MASALRRRRIGIAQVVWVLLAVLICQPAEPLRAQMLWSGELGPVMKEVDAARMLALSGQHAASLQRYRTARQLMLNMTQFDEDFFCAISCFFMRSLLPLSSYGEAEEVLLQEMTYRKNPLVFDGHFWHWAVEFMPVILDYYRGQQNWQKSVFWGEQQLSLYEQEYGADDANLLPILQDLEGLYQKSGETAKREAVLKRIAALTQAAAGSMHTIQSFSLDEQLAGIYEREHRFTEAEQERKKILKSAVESEGADSVTAVIALRRLGHLYHAKKSYDESRKTLAQASAILKAKPEPERNEVEEALIEREDARLAMDKRDYEGASAMFQHALAVLRRKLGDEHHEVALTYYDIARLCMARRLLPEAEISLSKAIAIWEKLNDEHAEESAAALRELGTLFWMRGSLRRAESQYQRARKKQEAAFGSESLAVAETLTLLGGVLWAKGVPLEAELWLMRARQIATTVLSPADPDLRNYMTNLAMVQLAVGRFADAEALLTEARQHVERVIGSASLEMAECLYNLALLYWSKKDFAQAEAMLKDALEKQQQLLGPENPELAYTVERLAELKAAQGDRRTEQSLRLEAQRLRERVYGLNAPENLAGLIVDARAALGRGDHRRAVTLLRDALAAEEGATSGYLLSGEEPVLRQSRELAELVYGLARRSPEGAALALQTALSHKGRATELKALVTRLVHENLKTAELQERFLRLRNLVASRESLVLGEAPSRPFEAGEVRQRLLALRSQYKKEFQLLVAALPELQELEPQNSPMLMKRVADALPEGGALLEIVQVKGDAQETLGAIQASTRPAASGSRYLGLLLRRGPVVTAHDLGAVDEVDGMVSALLADLSNNESNPVPHAKVLYQKIFAPLESELEFVRTLVVSADGQLNFVPFDALHDRDRYLLDRFLFQYVYSGRSLLKAASGRNSDDIVIFGNPAFHFASEAAQTSATDPRPTSWAAQLANLQELPGSESEARSVQNRLPSARLLLGRDASEENLRLLRDRPSILHFATHATFFKDSDDGNADISPTTRALPTLPLGTTVVVPSSAEPMRVANSFLGRAAQLPSAELPEPLSRGAVLLRGAAHAVSAANTFDDGVLSGSEILTFNWQGTQLAVVSGCNSGRGVAMTGDGVYGLRHAFFVAGVETLVISLWSVNDYKTGELMALYYANLLDRSAKRGRVTALHDAMRTLRSRPGREHPFYWAPFIAMGSDDMLRLRNAP